MPTDSLVDVVTMVKLVNVRRSRSEEAGQLVADLLDDKELAIWDKVELGPLQLIGETGASQVDNKKGWVPVPSPSGKYIIDDNGKAKPEMGEVPVPQAPKKYVHLPPDFDERAIAYLNEHPGSNLGEVSRHFTANIKTVYPHLESLIKQGKINKVKEGPSKMAPVKYYPASKTLEKVEKPEEIEPLQTSVPEPSSETVVPQQVIESFKGLRRGVDKDLDIKNSILKILEKSPGVGTNEIYHGVGKNVAHLARIRKLLIELEEEKKIATIKVPGQFGPHTGYYLKDVVPKEAC